jgi:hypothetical protein
MDFRFWPSLLHTISTSVSALISGLYILCCNFYFTFSCHLPLKLGFKLYLCSSNYRLLSCSPPNGNTKYFALMYTFWCRIGICWWNPFNAEWTGHQDILIDWPSVLTWLWLLTLDLAWLWTRQSYSWRLYIWAPSSPGRGRVRIPPP